jgi:hypothetical protein
MSRPHLPRPKETLRPPAAPVAAPTRPSLPVMAGGAMDFGQR